MKLNKKLILNSVSVVMVLIFAGIAGSASAENLLVNSDFESGDLTGWLVFGQSANSGVTVPSGDNGPAAPGSYNAFMENRGEALGLTLKQTTEQDTAIGGTVFYSYDLKLDEAAVGGVLFVEIFAEAEGAGIVGGSGLMGPLWPWEWTSYSGSFEAPGNTSFLTIQIMANTGAASGSSVVAHVDNVVLDQGTVPAESMQWNSVKALYR